MLRDEANRCGGCRAEKVVVLLVASSAWCIAFIGILTCDGNTYKQQYSVVLSCLASL